MDKQIVGICIQEAGRLITGILSLPKRSRQEGVKAKGEEPLPQVEMEEYDADEKIKKGVACIPCTNSHLLTCRGLLDEGHRMAHDGITPDVHERIDHCLGEIAAAERVDLSPANIAQLPEDEAELARYAAKHIREIRHELEGITDPQALEHAAAQTTLLQRHVSSEYLRVRLTKMTPGQREVFNKKLKVAINNANEEIKDNTGEAG